MGNFTSLEPSRIKNNQVLLTSAFALFVFSVLNFSDGKILQASIESFVGVSLTLLRIVPSRLIKPELISHILVGLCCLIVNTIFISGGYRGTGMLWVAGFPFLVFYMLSLRAAIGWLCVMGMTTLIMYAGSLMGMISLHVSDISLLVFVMLLFVYGAYAFFNERSHLAKQLRIKESSEQILQEQLERKNLESHLQSLLDSIEEVYFRVDMHGVIQDISKAVYTLSGYKPEELIGKPTLVMYSKQQRQEFLQILQKQGFVRSYELVMRSKDGHELVVSVNARLLLDDAGLACGIQGLASDISAERNAKRALNTLNQALQYSRDAAVRGSKAKSEFLSVMSHELRTPLHGIIGMHELLAEIPNMSEEQSQNLAAAQVAAKSLRSLVNDVLDLSKIEAGVMALQESCFELESCLRDALVPFLFQAKEKGLRLDLQLQGVPQYIYADQVRLRQVLLNLVGNAVKFTDHGFVRVCVLSNHQKVDGQLVFQVEDSGIGISEDDAEHIFEPFSQVMNLMDAKHQGTGLGTSISKNFVELMGGKIDLESYLGKGSCFTFSLPCRYESENFLHKDVNILEVDVAVQLAKHVDVAAIGKPNDKPWKLLLAEDDLVSQRIAQKRLLRAGFDVDLAEDGYSAWEKAQTGIYDVILMDIRMPGLDGLTITRNIRAMELKDGTYTPIIGVSAHALDEVKEACQQAGMDEFLMKPIEPNRVLSCVMEQVER